MSAIAQWFEHSLLLPFLETGMRIDLFQSCGHYWSFQIRWHIECNILIASPFRILNSSAGIPSHPLALLTVVLPKVQLTSHSRMSCFGWVTTPSWLSSSLRSFVDSSFMCSFHFFLISSTSSRFLLFFFFCAQLWGKCSLDISKFTVVSSIFVHCSLKNAFLSLLAILGGLCLAVCTFPSLPCFLLLFFLQLFVKPPQITTLPSCFSFLLGGFCSLPSVQCYELLFTVLQPHCLLDLILWIYSSPSLYIHKGSDLRFTWLA